MSRRHPTYIVAWRGEECECATCGHPLYVGDRVWTDSLEAVNYTACGPACATGQDAAWASVLARKGEVAQ